MLTRWMDAVPPVTSKRRHETRRGFGRVYVALLGGLFLLALFIGALELSACGDCASARADWLALVQRPKVLACTSDSQCILVGQSSTCDCSSSMAGSGAAVNGTAYHTAGGDKMLENYYAGCSGDKMGWCCDCAPMSWTGCVNGQCTIVQYGRCGYVPDGGVPKSPPDASAGDTAVIDAPMTALDS